MKRFVPKSASPKPNWCNAIRPRRVSSKPHRIAGLVLASASLLMVSLRGQQRETTDEMPLMESERIQHVLSRFAFGPTPALVSEVRQIGLDQWFEAQLSGDITESPLLSRRLEKYGSLDLSFSETIDKYRRTPSKDANERQRREARQLQFIPKAEVVDSILLRAVYGNHQLREVASDFFRNHFNISLNKGQIRMVGAHYERVVIREGVLTSFGDMLRASAQHPAMLIYLDNALSRRPPSKSELRQIGRRTRRKTGSKERAEESIEIAKQRGLNENYARELLELHTLGVDNYYRQKDVIEVAKALTGWTVGLNGDNPGFRFRRDMHSAGSKRVLGRTIESDHGDPKQEGMQVLAHLERHPGTAKYLAWKLCRYFVADAPPKDMVKRIAAVFRKKKGDLPSVYRAIYQDREFFNPANYQSKFKRPFEFVTSALRVTQAEITSTKAIHRTLRELSEPTYECEDPTGYYDQAEAWRDPGVMAVRWRFAMDLARGRIKGVKIPESFYAGLHPTIYRVWQDQLADIILPAGLSAHTRKTLDNMVRAYKKKHKRVRRRDLAPLIVGLLLGSPDFQRQ